MDHNDHNDLIDSLHRTAQTTHTNNQRRQTNRQVYAQDDAESRAFHAERAQLGMAQAHDNEQREHALTRLAMRRLVAVNVGLRRAIRRLAEKWAAQEGMAAEAFHAAVLAEAHATADFIERKPESEPVFAQTIEILRDGQRLGPKP